MGADQFITKGMLQLRELEKLRPDRHKAALINLLYTENWHMDARKCIEVKLTEWALERRTEEGEGAEDIYQDEEDI